MNTPMLRSTLAAAMMLAFSGISGAAGLGRINVLSALGQPLRAEVEIAASPDDLESMVAKMAAPDAFRRANIEYAGALSGVRMSIDKRSGNAVVRITSDKPFSEPFVDMLIELNWAGGRLLREYTFLLDPAESTGQKSLAAVSEPVAKPIIDSKRDQASPSRDKAAAKPVATAPREIIASGEDYTVKNGDTLSRIAAAVKPVEVTQDQMVAALYQANSSQFIGGNINRLRAGRILKVPQADEAKQIPASEARKIILKASNFEQYKQTLASSAASGPAKESVAGQSASGKIAPKVEEPEVATQTARDRVKITATQPAKGGAAETPDAGAKARLQSLQDDLASRDKALKEAQTRVADLERNVKELQKLVELKSQGLAEAEKKAADAASVANDAKALAAQADLAKQAEAEKAAKLAEALAASAPAASSAPVAAVASEPVKSAEPAAAESMPVVVQQSAAAPAIVAAPTATEADDGGILGNPLAWLGIGVAALGAGYVVLKQRRRSQGPATTQLSEASTTSPNSVFGSAGGQTVDTGGTSLLHTDFSQSGLSAIDTDEGVDPVAEADVYMAYGRDAQAEEILLDALKNDPTRTAIYVKLLEIYAQRRSLKQFENIAADLYTQTGGVGDDWAKAAAIGARLDPENPLYKATAVASQKADEDILTIPEVAEAHEEEIPAVPAAAPQAVSFGTNNISQMRSTWTVPGEIGQFVGTAEGAELPMMVEPPAPVAPSAPSAPAAPESLNLDFNLDLELAESEDQHTEVEHREPAVPVAPQVAASPEAEFDAEDTAVPLEFDLGFDEVEKASEPNVAGSSDVTVLLPPKETPVAPAVTAPVASAPLDSVDDLDIDLGIERAMVQTSMAVVDLEKTNFEGNLLDFDFELGEDSQKTALDLSDMHLNTQVGTGGVSTAASVDTAASPEQMPDSIDVDDEVSTKLELARAYEEMGDSEGARELLEEVIADGNGSQQELARTILQRIA